MEATYIGLTDFISGEKVCVIPVYQRNYDWKKSHCDQLFKDLESLLNQKKPEHFLGTVVYQAQKPNAFTEQIIIDGQQRITSVILLAKAVYDLSDSAEIRKRIYTAFIKNSEYDTEFKLRPSEFDSEVFKKLMDGKTFDDMETSRLYLNYKFFKDKILNSGYELSAIREAINKFQIVALKLGNENPQEIFESLNSTGKDLTQTELIRNFLLMDLNSNVQENFYKKYWLPMERILQNSETVETFMFQYLVSKRKTITDMKNSRNIHISKNALYPTFKKYFSQNYSGEKTEQVEKFLANLYHYAEFYSRLLFDQNTNFENLSALDKKFYELKYQVGASSSPIILMDLNDKYEKNIFDAETFLQMVDALISLTFRAKICRQDGADSAQSAGNILSRLEKNPPISIDAFWAAITEGNGKYSFPNDEQFKQALSSSELYLNFKGDNCKYLLYTLEKHCGNAQNLPPYENIFLDLVMPRKLNKDWKKYLESKKDLDNHEIYFNSLGNLILTEEDKKDSSIFNDKRVKFATSKFYYTNSLQNYSDWTSKQIRRRAETLAIQALKIWIFPEKYQKSFETDENNFTLDRDFRILTGRKPKMLSILDKSKEVRHWRDLFREVLNSLNEADEDIFTESAKDFISTNSSKFREPLQIGDKFYIEVNFDVKTLLGRLKIIVEKFDIIGGTNFKSEIWFTLKS